jgi:RHS repeat-associated protein
MTCRAPTGSTTCVSPQTGAQLSYDPAGQLTTWVNRPGGTTTDQFLYDGEGQRVAQQITASGVTTTTVYVGSLEEVSTTGGTTNTTTYYAAAGMRLAEAVNGVFSYLGSDGLGSAVVALDGSSTLQASILYGPYGGVRYTSGTMPGTYGFTGQRADSTTGLDYYGARYYDLTAKQFITADTVDDGANRYGYVAGNPTTDTDPTGHRPCYDDACRGHGGDSGCTSNCNPPPCTGSNCPGSGCGGGHDSCTGGGGAGPCKPDSPTASKDCKAWAYDAKQYRNKHLQGLSNEAYGFLTAGYAVVVAGDLLGLIAARGFEKLRFLADLLATLATGLLPSFGAWLQGTGACTNCEAGFIQFSSWINGAIAIVHTWLSAYEGLWAWLKVGIDVAIEGMMSTVAPQVNMTLRLITALLPAVAGMVDAVGHGLLAKGQSDLAEWTRQQDMDIVSWCQKYGGGDCGEPIPTK